MSLEINILAQKNPPITKDIPLKLKDYTIFAGENNAGKTKLIRLIKDELENRGLNVIYIPAERVIVDAELATGAKDPFTSSLSELIDIALTNDPIKSFIEDIEDALPKEFSQYKVKNIEIQVNKKQSLDEEYKKAIKDAYIKKIIDSITINDGYCEAIGVKSSEVGQGTQRLIIASFISYLSAKKFVKNNGSDRVTYIIFEEPETYLHPRLKQDLHEHLLSISQNEKRNVKIIVSTHDPYFIELSKPSESQDKIQIYKVERDKDLEKQPTKATVQEGGKFVNHYKSYAEINYQVFGLPTETYFLELYETLKTNTGFDGIDHPAQEFDDEYLAGVKNVPQDCPNDEKSPNKMTKFTRFRHDVAHAKRKSKDEVDNIIKEIISLYK